MYAPNVPASFEKTYAYYFPILFRFGLKHTSDVALSKDLAQDTLIKLWESKNQKNWDTKYIEAFLFKTLKNKIIDHFRHLKVRRAYQGKIDRLSLIQKADTLFDVQDRIDKVFKKLPEKTATIFKYSREKDTSYKKMAEHFGLSIKSIEFHISKALKFFREEFNKRK